MRQLNITQAKQILLSDPDHEEVYAWPKCYQAEDHFAYVVVFKSSKITAFSESDRGWAALAMLKKSQPDGWQFDDSNVDLDELPHYGDVIESEGVFQASYYPSVDLALSMTMKAYDLPCYFDDDGIVEIYKKQYVEQGG